MLRRVRLQDPAGAPNTAEDPVGLLSEKLRINFCGPGYIAIFSFLLKDGRDFATGSERGARQGEVSWRTAKIVFFLLLLSGDVHLNPGPTPQLATSDPVVPHTSPVQMALTPVADSPRLISFSSACDLPLFPLPGSDTASAPVGVSPIGTVGAALAGPSPERWVAWSGGDSRQLRRTVSLQVPGATNMGDQTSLPIRISLFIYKNNKCKRKKRGSQ